MRERSAAAWRLQCYFEGAGADGPANPPTDRPSYRGLTAAPQPGGLVSGQIQGDRCPGMLATIMAGSRPQPLARLRQPVGRVRRSAGPPHGPARWPSAGGLCYTTGEMHAGRKGIRSVSGAISLPAPLSRYPSQPTLPEPAAATDPALGLRSELP